jgi:hypothetical protein
MGPETVQGGPLSLRAYGRHRESLGLAGASAVAVSRAIDRKRLVKSVIVVDGVPQIASAELADQEWAENTDLSRAPSSVRVKSGGVTSSMAVTPDAPVTDVKPVTPSAPTRGKRGNTLVEASTREKNAKADLAELEFFEKTKEVIPAKAVAETWAEMVVQMRAAVLSVPSKAKTALPHLTHADLATLNDLLCQALEGLAQ